MLPFVVAAAASAQPVRPQSNLGRYQLATGAGIDDHAPDFVADGKVGPRNRLLTNNRGRHRVNIFFEEPVEVGSLHVYSGLFGAAPLAGFTVNYQNGDGLLVPAPGGTVSGNADAWRAVQLSQPVTTTRLQLSITDATASVAEIAVFPPNGGQGFPLGTDVELNQARQHRLAITTASSTEVGTTRRAAVDGFSGAGNLWRSDAAGPHWFDMSMEDPPETSPVSVRVTNTPVHVRSVHVHAGDSGGQGIPARGRVQRFDDQSGLWITIPGATFSGNSQADFAILFDSEVVASRFRLRIDDATPVALREVVLLPPGPDAGGWPLGTSAVAGDAPVWSERADGFFGLIDSSGGVISVEGGAPFVQSPTGRHDQQFQLIASLDLGVHRIRNRSTGLTLAEDPGTGGLAQAGYLGQPHQLWELVDAPGGFRIVNAMTGKAVSSDGSSLSLAPFDAGDPAQVFGQSFAAHFPKKGNGEKSPQNNTTPARFTPLLDSEWAYNWGKNDIFPDAIEYWPMQWGSFSWDVWPMRTPLWHRQAEPLLLMGYNEPDSDSQSDVPVSTGIELWPRNEATGFPLVAPAPTNNQEGDDWLAAFDLEADAREYRRDYASVHWYGTALNTNAIMNTVNSAANACDCPVVLSEFSPVDWSDTNSWDKDDAYDWYAEVLYRLERSQNVARYAVFAFGGDPSNPISDNRGELIVELSPTVDPVLTPAGRLYAAWDGDVQLRTDTEYHVHNRGRHARIGVNQGQPAGTAVRLGDRSDLGADFSFVLEPTPASSFYRVRSVSDGRLLMVVGDALHFVVDAEASADAEFRIAEVEHGRFFFEDQSGRHVGINGAGQLELFAPGTTGANVHWRFIRVHEAPPAAPRGVNASLADFGKVRISWDAHGFRDLDGMEIRRTDSSMVWETVATSVYQGSFVDAVPAPGNYVYEVRAVGDTGSSGFVSTGAIAVEVCEADFNADFALNSNDLMSVITAVDAGADLDGSGGADIFDIIWYTERYDEGCALP
ncbi:MAG: glycosyl hydrolase [Planctomycetota bacterium]